MNFIDNIKNKYDLPVLVSLIFLPIASLICIPIYIVNYGIVWQEIAMLFIGWFFAGTGITIGYHRLFAHRTFKTYSIIEWFYMLTGSMALQNSILHWCSDHRRHHKKLDTKDDPYSIKEGFFHAHIGWIIKKSNNNYAHVSDLERKSAVKFQKKYYWTIALFLSFVLPVIIGFTYGRPIGGLLWGGVLRTTLVHHFTFFINSLCHYLGNREYDPSTSARDSWIMAFLTFGEGYHNYHHKFQWDYRNGIRWYNFDPSKWIIEFLSLFNITYGLRKVPDYLILQAKVDTVIKKIKYFSGNQSLYLDRINKITRNVRINLDLLKKLEKKYKLIKNNKNISLQLNRYNKQKNIYKLELQNAVSSLLIILINIKNLG